MNSDGKGLFLSLYSFIKFIQLCNLFLIMHLYMHILLLYSWKIQINIVIQFLELLPFNGRNTADKEFHTNQSIKQFLGENLPLRSFLVVHLSLLFLSITPLPCDFIFLLIPAGGVHVGRSYRSISGSFTDLVFNVIVAADWTGYQRFHWNKYP